MALKVFEVSTAPAKFVADVEKNLQGRPLGEIVSVKTEGSGLVVRFSKLGSSELVYAVAAQGEGFRAELKKESIAFTHRAFRSEIERKLCKVLERCGAQILS